MIDAYAAVAAYVDRVPELEDKISAAYRQVCNARPEFDSFNGILGASYPPQEQWVRHVAWLSQHALGNRAHCVGNKVLLARDGSHSSPLVGQVARLGYAPYTQQFDSPEKILGGHVRALTQVDAMVVDRPINKLYIVKGITYDRAVRGARQSMSKGMPLFAPVADGAERLFVPRRKIACLGLAYRVLIQAFPKLGVVPVVLVVDPVDMGCRFKAYDLSGAMLDALSNEVRQLGDYPQIASSETLRAGGGDLDDVRYLPRWSGIELLNCLPVDRATRCLILLSLLWEKQRSLPGKLAVIRASRLAEQVRSRYLIEYPKDLRRHDLEDCLERGGFIERPAYEGNAFALTPKGLARHMLVRRLFSGKTDIEDDNDVTTHVLSHVHKQAELWVAYREGQAVCG